MSLEGNNSMSKTSLKQYYWPTTLQFDSLTKWSQDPCTFAVVSMETENGTWLDEQQTLNFKS